MRKVVALFFSILIVFTIACSKDHQGPKLMKPLPLIVPDITGKWAFHSSVGINLSSDAINSSLLADTLIFSADLEYIIIKNRDTVNQGIYSVGSRDALNGYGKKQAYDSIGFKSNAYLADPVYPLTIYYMENRDTLSCSALYYRDSSKERQFVNYVRK